MSGNNDSACTRNSWIAGAAGGLVIMAFMLGVGDYSFMAALFFGVLFLILFGMFLIWAFCSGAGEVRADSRATSRAAAIAGSAAAGTMMAGNSIAGRAPEPVAGGGSSGAAAAKVSAKPVEQPVATPASAQPAAAASDAAKPAAAASVAAPVAEQTSAVAGAPSEPAAAKPSSKGKSVAKAGVKTGTKSAPRTGAKAQSASKAKSPVQPDAMAKDKVGAKAPAKAAEKPAPKAAAAKPKRKAGDPELLTAPRAGKADDLKQIKGVGPKLEAMLNGIGVWHFDQVASWGAKDVTAIDAKLEGFNGRITRDDWVKQAKILAKGGATEFSRRVTKGDVY